MDDRVIKKIIDSGQQNYTSDWGHMESRLSETFGPLADSETPFDRELQEKLGNAQNYKSNWANFMGSYKISQSKRRRFMALKVCELIILLLLIMNIKYIPNKSNVYTSDIESISSNELSIYDGLRPENSEAVSTEVDMAIAEGATENSADAMESHSEVPGKESLIGYVDGVPPFVSEKSLAIDEFSSKNSIPLPSREVTTTDNNKNEANSLFTKEYSQSSNRDKGGISTSRSQTTFVKSEAYTVQFLESLRLHVKENESKDYVLVNNLQTNTYPDIIELTTSGDWSLLLGGGVTLNAVHTPKDVDRNFSSYDHSGFGLKLSAKVIKAFRNSDLITGIEYQSIKYNNRNVRKRIIQISAIEQTENYTVAMPTQLDFKVIRVPLEYRKYYHSDSEARLFVLGGASAAYTMSSKYYLTDYEVNPNQQSISEIEVSPALQNRDLGGRFHFGLRAGVGIESILSEKVAFHVQGGYEHFFGKGIGPSLDRIQGITLDVGIRMSL